jgi:hypothetical protein
MSDDYSLYLMTLIKSNPQADWLMNRFNVTELYRNATTANIMA